MIFARQLAEGLLQLIGIGIPRDAEGPKENLRLQIESDTLTLEGNVVLDLPEGMEANHVEVSLPSYRRVFTLSKELDANKVVAELKHGMLKLRIPKVEHAQTRKVKIQVT